MTKILDHPGGIRSAIDVIADMEQQRPRRRALGEVGGDRRVQRLELHEAAVDVADRIDAPTGRHGGRRGR